LTATCASADPAQPTLLESSLLNISPPIALARQTAVLGGAEGKMEGAPVVLVIEDEEPSQEIVHDALQEGGFDATTERPNLRQNAVFGQTVRVSSTVDVATHRPAAMAVARVGAAKARLPAHLLVPHRFPANQEMLCLPV
jgi:hypothetical protein